jgi:hypothetical protein
MGGLPDLLNARDGPIWLPDPIPGPGSESAGPARLRAARTASGPGLQVADVPAGDFITDRV